MKLFSVMSVEKNRSKCNERESGRSSRCCGSSSLEVSLTVDHVHTSTSTLDEISSLVDYYFNSLTHNFYFYGRTFAHIYITRYEAKFGGHLWLQMIIKMIRSDSGIWKIKQERTKIYFLKQSTTRTFDTLSSTFKAIEVYPLKHAFFIVSDGQGTLYSFECSEASVYRSNSLRQWRKRTRRRWFSM